MSEGKKLQRKKLKVNDIVVVNFFGSHKGVVIEVTSKDTYKVKIDKSGTIIPSAKWLPDVVKKKDKPFWWIEEFLERPEPKPKPKETKKAKKEAPKKSNTKTPRKKANDKN